MTSEEYNHYQSLFAYCKKSCKLWTWILLVTSLSSMLYYDRVGLPDVLHPFKYFKEHNFSVLVFLTIYYPARKIVIGTLALAGIFDVFVSKSSIQAAVDSYRSMAQLKSKVEPNFATFLCSFSLREFEESHVQYYSELRSKALKRRQIEDEERLIKERLHQVESEKLGLQKIAEAKLLSVQSPKEVRFFKKKLKQAKTVEELQSIILEIGDRLDTPIEVERRQSAKVLELQKHLAEVSVRGVCPEAEILLTMLEGGMHLRYKIDLLKRAISFQQDFNKRPVAEEQKEEAS